MPKLQDLLQRKQEVITAMEGMIAAVDTEQRDFTDDETKTYEALDKELGGLSEDITKVTAEVRRERLEQAKKTLAAPAVIIPGRTQDETEFRNLGEFVQAVVTKRDKRLNNVEFREHSMSDGTSGGFLVPKKFTDTLLSVSPAEAAIRPRARVIPAGDPPDATNEIPSLDQTADQNMYGGVTVSWLGEGDTKPEANLKVKMVSLTPKEVAAHVILTDKLMRNAPRMSTILESMMRAAIIGAEETAFVSGNGVAKPLGILNSPACIFINRQTANQISFTDITNMFARIRMGGSFVWIASQTIIPQLVAIKDANNNNLFLSQFRGGVIDSIPTTLMGYPILFYDRSPVLGSKGDLMLVDANYYLIQNGSGPFVGTSEHVYFISNKTVIKVFWNVDGQPWLTGPFVLEGTTSSTVSPFVVLDTP